MNTRRLIHILRAHDFTKEFRAYEFEIKYEIKPSRHGGTLTILHALQRCLKGSPRYLAAGIPGGDRLTTTVKFYAGKQTEYSLFSYRGVRMVKVKKHRIIRHGSRRIFKNDEKLLIDRRDFASLPASFRRRFRRHSFRLVSIATWLTRLAEYRRIGTMKKLRVKDFVLDKQDGRVYAVSVSVCTSGGRRQKQLEIEYAGFLPGFPRRSRNNERQVVSRLCDMARIVEQCLGGTIRPTIERKYTFVKKNAR